MSYLDKGIALIIADLLSLITIASCLVIKVPQIRTIQATKSARGISVVALMLELFSYTTMMSYNYINDYAILSYLEYPILLIQEYVLIYLVLKYNGLLGTRTFAAAIAYVLIGLCVLTKIMPLWILATLVPFCTPIGATSKIMQLIAIVRAKDSSAISLTTWALSAFTNSTRIYTVMVESGDLMLLGNFTISFLLSSSVFLAAYIYKKPKEE